MARTVLPNDMLTPAEHVALHQILAGGPQTLELSGQGAAAGGSFHLEHLKTSTPAELLVPNGVTAVMDAAVTQALYVAGNLTNHGSIYAFSSNSSIDTAAIFALNVLNQENALISSTVPTSLSIPGALPVNLLISATQDVTNAGTIDSAGNLTVNAGHMVFNTSGAQTAVIKATQSVNILSSAGHLVNSGVISALAQNVNINASVTNDLLINNWSGRLEAPSGSINLRDNLYNGRSTLLILGGELSSKQLFLNGGSGLVALHANQIDALVNASGAIIKGGVSAGTLSLGRIAAQGPFVGVVSLYNLEGDIEVRGDITASPFGLITLSSGRDISAKSGAGRVSTASPAGSLALSLVAGGLFSSTLGQVPKLGPLSRSDAFSKFIWNGISKSGGKIDLASEAQITEMSTKATSGNADGGAVVLAAFYGAATGSGTIKVPTAVAITSGGSGTGTNGTIAMVAGAPAGASIMVGDLNAAGGNGVALGVGRSEDPLNVEPMPTEDGKVLLRTGQPMIQAGVPYQDFVVVGATQLESINSFPPVQIQPASIQTGRITSGGADTAILAGGSISTGTIQVGNQREIRVRAGLGASGEPMARRGDITVRGSLIADDVVICAGRRGSLTFLGQEEPLRIQAGVTREGMLCAQDGIYVESARGQNIFLNGNVQVMGDLHLEAGGGLIQLDDQSLVSVFEGRATLNGRSYVNTDQLSADFGVFLRSSSFAVNGVALTDVDEANVIPQSVSSSVFNAVGYANSGKGVPTDTAKGRQQEAPGEPAKESRPVKYRATAGRAQTRTPHAARKNLSIEGAPPTPDEEREDLARVIGKAGFMVYGWFSGNTKLETNHGEIVTQTKGGTKITQLKDGSKITEFKDGSKVTEIGGMAIKTYPDGTMVTDYGNGTTSTKYKDGTTVVSSRDGTTIATYPDGTTVSGSSTGTVTVTYASGKRVTCLKDGTKTTEMNGTTTIEYPDGRKEVRQGPQGMRLPENPLRQGSQSEVRENHKDKPRTKSEQPTSSPCKHAALRLPVGHVVMSPAVATAIGMVEGTSCLSPGSVALMGETGADGAVLNFYDAQSGGVSVEVAGHVVKLPPGHEIVITNKLDADYDAVNPFPEIPYRNVTEHLLTDKIKVFIAEFSMPQAIRTIEPINRLFKSERPDERKLARAILKTAAGLALVRRGESRFTVKRKPILNGPAT